MDKEIIFRDLDTLNSNQVIVMKFLVAEHWEDMTT